MALAPQSAPVDKSQLPPVLIPGEIVPPAVKEMGSLADRLQAEHIARMNGELPPEPAPAIEPVVVAPVVPEPVTPVVTQPGNDPELQLPPPAQPGTDEAKWEHSYKSAKGRFDADRQRMQLIIDGQAAEIRRLQSAPAPVAQPAGSVISPTSPLDLAAAGISEEDISTWGPDIFEAVDKIVQQRMGGLRAEIRPQVDAVAQSVHQDAEMRMGSALNQQLAALTGGQVDFDQINQDQNFIAWLDLPDRMSGVKRGDLLLDAWNSRDGSRVLEVCKAYLGDSAVAAPTPVVDPKTLPAGNSQVPAQAPKVPLTSLAAPGRARAPAPANGSVTDKPTYTRADVKAFYAAKQRGFYASRPNGEAEAQGYEAEIIAAGNEGRIIG